MTFSCVDFFSVIASYHYIPNDTECYLIVHNNAQINVLTVIAP